MKAGLLDGRLGVSSRSEHEEARSYVARWIGSESTTGARFIHDTLEEFGWEVRVADAQKVKGLAPLACTTDKIDARVLAEPCWRDLVPAIWQPDPSIRRERELARYRSNETRNDCARPMILVGD